VAKAAWTNLVQFRGHRILPIPNAADSAAPRRPSHGKEADPHIAAQGHEFVGVGSLSGHPFILPDRWEGLRSRLRGPAGCGHGRHFGDYIPDKPEDMGRSGGSNHPLSESGDYARKVADLTSKIAYAASEVAKAREAVKRCIATRASRRDLGLDAFSGGLDVVGTDLDVGSTHSPSMGESS